MCMCACVRVRWTDKILVSQQWVPAAGRRELSRRWKLRRSRLQRWRSKDCEWCRSVDAWILSADTFLHRALSCGTVYCNRPYLFVFVDLCVCLWVCYHDNSKLCASIFIKLGLWVKVVTISSWLNFGRPAPSGRGSTAGRKFLAPPYYSQRAVFVLPLKLYAQLYAQLEVVCSVPGHRAVMLRYDCECWPPVRIGLSSQSWLQPSMPPQTSSTDFCLLLSPGVIHGVCRLWRRILRFLFYVNNLPHSPSSASLAFLVIACCLVSIWILASPFYCQTFVGCVPPIVTRWPRLADFKEHHGTAI